MGYHDKKINYIKFQDGFITLKEYFRKTRYGKVSVDKVLKIIQISIYVNHHLLRTYVFLIRSFTHDSADFFTEGSEA